MARLSLTSGGVPAKLTPLCPLRLAFSCPCICTEDFEPSIALLTGLPVLAAVLGGDADVENLATEVLG